MTRKELIEKAMAFRADTVKRGSARHRAEIEKHVDQFDPHAEDNRKRIGLYSHHQSGRDRGTVWKGKSWAASPGVVSPVNDRKGFDDDVFDAAAVAKGKKPAALMMGGHTPQAQAHIRHYIDQGMAKGKIISHPGVLDADTGGVDPTAGGRYGFYFGKRKNVHKLMRMDQRAAQDKAEKKTLKSRFRGRMKSRFRGRIPDSSVRREHQLGATIGYPREKVDRFLDRAATKFPKFDLKPKRVTTRRRFDVVKQQPGRTIGRNKLGVPVGKLPEEIFEASIDHFTPKMYAAARRMERGIRNKRLDSFERRDLKRGKSVHVGEYKVKHGAYPVELRVGGIPGLASNQTQYMVTPDYSERWDTVSVNAGHAFRQGIPWQGRHAHRKFRSVNRRNVVGNLAHELMHATDPAYEFDFKKDSARAGKGYSRDYATALEKGGKHGALYNITPSEVHARAGEIMYGLHRGKRDVGRTSSRDILRYGGLIPNPIRTQKGSVPVSRIQNIHTYNNFVSRHLDAHRKYAQEFEGTKHGKRAKKAYRKLAKETYKGIERLHGSTGRRMQVGRRKLGVPARSGALPEEFGAEWARNRKIES